MSVEPPIKPQIVRQERLLLGLVLLLAAVLRLGWPGLTEFKADEARLLALALEMAQGGGLALRGISSSVGFPNFPMSVWLYALPSLLWPHPYAATLFTGLLNTLAVAGCYWLVRRYWGAKAALAAALLLAVNPWAVIFSRKIWAQNLLPLFVTGWAIGAALALVERRPRFIWLHLLCLAMAVQIHLAAVVLLPATAVLLIIFRQRVAWRQVVAGGVLGVATAVPFAIYLLQSGQLGVSGLTMLAKTGDASTPWLESLRFVWLLATGREIYSLAGPEAYLGYLARVPDLAAVQLLWAGLGLLGLGVTVWQMGRRWGEPAAEVGLIVILGLLLPALFFAFWHRSPVFLHYFIAVLPSLAMLGGIGLAWLVDEFIRSAGTKAAVSGAFVFSAVLQVYVWALLLQFLGRQATPGGFGVPLERLLAGAEAAQALLLAQNASEILIASEAESPALGEFAAVYDVLLHPMPHRFVDLTQATLFPGQTAVVLAAPGMAVELYEAAAVARQAVPLRQGEPSLQVLAVPGGAAPVPAVVFDPVLIWTNWASLMGYSGPERIGDDPTDAVGTTAVWQLFWHTGANPDPADYHFFNHLLDGAGQRLAQADAAAFSPPQWREGDVVVSHFLLDWPADPTPPLTMRVGMYRFPSLENVPVFDVAGNPGADAVEIRIR